jgi:lysophospholipid acyltransferase (LPLAT)-like uncharacterized protein
MARDFIKIDTAAAGATQAGLLRSYVQTLRTAYEQGQKVRAIMSHNNDGAVFTDIEGLFGLPTGKGQTVFDLVNGSIGAMEGTFQVDDAKVITEKVG